MYEPIDTWEKAAQSINEINIIEVLDEEIEKWRQMHRDILSCKMIYNYTLGEVDVAIDALETFKKKIIERKRNNE